MLCRCGNVGVVMLFVIVESVSITPNETEVGLRKVACEEVRIISHRSHSVLIPAADLAVLGGLRYYLPLVKESSDYC